MADNRLSVALMQIEIKFGAETVTEDKYIIGRVSGHWFIGESNNFKCKRYLGKNDFEIIGSILADNKSDIEQLLGKLEIAQRNSRQTLAQAFHNRDVAKAMLGYTSMIATGQDVDTQDSAKDLQNRTLALLEKSGKVISEQMQQRDFLSVEVRERLNRYFL